jgi:CRP-like cAMP-binding protein
MRSATQRVIGYLLRPDHDHDESGGQMLVTLPASKSVIASRLNITPEHFSRVLHELTEARLIEVAGRSVSILDMEKLSSFEG